ncbi:lmo0937 family membrane protein [Neobacillus mesonae]|uniref:lmo0937 family membrane protein n=1 Tax=Neobacillus mesonae TaxID=1193713 RepID=UPI000ACA7EB2|nr:lmo0937 family membrane protein [Neobacillus mesonae]MED4205413.1 lmo0937 family membrane protein [Neobacillus mesonae]
MIWTIIGLLLLFWVLGLVFHVAGGLIHLLLVVAVVVFIIKLFTGRTNNRA